MFDDASSDEDRLATLLGLAAGRPTAVVRFVGLALVCAGLVHLVWPERLLSTGRVGYDLALDVRFEPRDGAAGRVRLAGAAMVAAGSHLLSHGGVFAAEHDG